MLRSVTELSSYAICATDGEIGKADQFYFDDATWTLRYLVVRTGDWLTGRLVLISPVAISTANRQAGVLSIQLTKDQIRNSPDMDTDMPVFRQREIALAKYYGWPCYWGLAVQAALATATGAEEEAPEKHDPHLRSTQEVMGYNIQAQDGELGHVEDFIVDEETWAIRFMVVDTRNWWPGKKVLVAPTRVNSINWFRRQVCLDLPRDEIRNRPEFDAEQFRRGESSDPAA